ncbi:MAG: DNA cytosine methyltransferase [Chloroflexi bacterium]|nr:DNA cytosine methyltransferase [Chloroflexota bacterium]
MLGDLHKASSLLNGAEPWPVLSLFSGAGGFDLGFRRAGFRPGLAVDFDPAAVSTYRWNQPDTYVSSLDIAETDPDEFVNLWMSINGDEKPVGIIGGPPCQAFSVSNVHQKRGDPRQKLLVHYANVIQSFTSRLGLDFFVFENVPGLAQQRHRRRYLEFKRLCKKAGYNVREKVVNAGRFGIPQNRKRVIVIGVNRERYPDLVLDPPEGNKQPVPVSVALDGLPEPAFCRRDLGASEIPHHPNHVAMVPRSRKFVDGTLKPGDHRGRSFRVLSWDQPSYAVAYGHREVHVHPDMHRRLSIYEAMRLQGFPHTYELKGTFSQQVQLVSDALPPPLGEGLATAISEGLGYVAKSSTVDTQTTI